ncbi:unnamed protein product [Didymodactylos carnosus]|uniref:Phosphogluconate dehydrogenase NAD-binding putative C-terminal domain-containing protein n=1 Tax=Didymodactylos carnosus TaxID=1234261 RepID=A0A815BZS6_9BILA|nr:unnamed protein product [Didymodactylos carnosus]CAF1298875.1 unnamed protein product [Didymodactylos carnosus]CAF4074633.1 unnamed protein product [Didymodactylos carnosus]CAF4104656.1 unnamed protein product [Didymodactylos carnosus]
MGHAIGSVLSRHENIRVITNVVGRSPRTVDLAKKAGMITVNSYTELIEQVDVLLSILVPSQAIKLAKQIQQAIKPDSKFIYADLNAVSPSTVKQMEQLFDKYPNIQFVDGGILGGPPDLNGKTPKIYLSGEHAQQLEFLRDYGLDIRVIGNEVGQASGLKMCYAATLKGFTAIAIQASVTSKMLGLGEVLFNELKDSQPYVFKRMQSGIPDMAPKAYRWVGEMEEIASTFESMGLSPKIFQGAADTYRFVADQTPLGKEIVEDRKLGKTLGDAVDIMAQSLAGKKP